MPVPAKGYQSPPRVIAVLWRGTPVSDRWFRGPLLIFDSVTSIYYAVPSVNHVQIILALGVIQLTLLDAAPLDRVIRGLARDPRYSSILHMRTGVDTRSSGGSSSTATQFLEKDSSDQIPPAQAMSSSLAENNGGDDTRPPILPHSLCFQAAQK